MKAGTKLAGRYVLAELLGRGAMGEVWRATDLVLDRPVAVKVISEWHTDPELASRLNREARITAGLQHPGIVVVHDVGSFDGRPFIVMELLHGRDLASIVKQFPNGLPVDRVISLAIQAADAVQAAHAKHVVHRDLKPANLFLQDSGNLKICDFGIARAAETTAGLTAAGHAIGTILYMSPEQCEGKQVDRRSDLYSLGCVLYELVTGEPPFRAEWPAIMYRHMTKAPSSPRNLRPDIPVKLDTLILELLAKDPSARPVNAGRVATALKALQQPGLSTSARPARQSEEPRSTSRSVLALRYAVRSDVGLLRAENEDSAYAGPHLLAVADGLGGHSVGQVASAVTIASMAKLDSEPLGDMLAKLSSAVAAAYSRLQEMIIGNPAAAGMGTTLTALLWSNGHAAVCHIGDSRCYLLRERELYQVTRDHTLVQSLVDEGRISANDVSTHPQRSQLRRVLNGRSIAEPDLSEHEGLIGDRYLLCSDGLSDVVSDETLRDVLDTSEDPEAVSLQLIERALRGGGPDNITCIVADVVDAALVPPTRDPILVGAAAASPVLSAVAPAQRYSAEAPRRPRRLEYSAPPALGNVGRNDPCPCGSGRKYKRCHGDPRMRPNA